MNTAMKPHVKILHQLKAKGIITVEEIAQLLECSLRKVYKILEGEGDFSAEEIRSISAYLSEMGRNELSLQFLSPKYGITYKGSTTTNNDVDDEIADIVMHLGRAKTKFAKRDKDKFAAVIEDLTKALRSLEAEGHHIE